MVLENLVFDYMAFDVKFKGEKIDMEKICDVQ